MKNKWLKHPQNYLFRIYVSPQEQALSHSFFFLKRIQGPYQHFKTAMIWYHLLLFNRIYTKKAIIIGVALCLHLHVYIITSENVILLKDIVLMVKFKLGENQVQAPLPVSFLFFTMLDKWRVCVEVEGRIKQQIPQICLV